MTSEPLSPATAVRCWPITRPACWITLSSPHRAGRWRPTCSGSLGWQPRSASQRSSPPARKPRTVPSCTPWNRSRPRPTRAESSGTASSTPSLTLPSRRRSAPPAAVSSSPPVSAPTCAGSPLPARQPGRLPGDLRRRRGRLTHRLRARHLTAPDGKGRSHPGHHRHSDRRAHWRLPPPTPRSCALRPVHARRLPYVRLPPGSETGAESAQVSRVLRCRESHPGYDHTMRTDELSRPERSTRHVTCSCAQFCRLARRLQRRR